MINSRSLSELHPRVQQMASIFLGKCQEEGIDLLVTSTYRDHESQAALYAQGRTKPGAIVTKAKPGQSWHNWRCALDVVPLRNGKPVWNYKSDADAALWASVIRIAKESGLEPGPAWEKAHFQYTGGLTLADFQAGKTLPQP